MDLQLPRVTKVLIVEDEPAQMEVTRRALESHGTFQLTFAKNAQTAFQRLGEELPDLVLMDLGLPDCDGLDVCRRMKEEERLRWLPVIILTGRSNVVDKITGLEVGADDYLTKPFDPGELVARVRAVLRRKQALGPVTDYEQNGFKISADRRQVWLNNTAVPMTPKEFDLLLMMVSKRGAVLTREEIGQTIWGKSAEESARTLDTHIWRLRSKLGDFSDHIETVGKNGYRFNNAA
jgi:two-component system, OmpR family, alkaline phosphatase synthesis response regulator PhoP